MIRSAWDLEWDARIWRGARDAELRAIDESTRRMTAAMRQLGLGFRVLGRPLAQAAAEMSRALAALSVAARTQRGDTEWP